MITPLQNVKFVFTKNLETLLNIKGISNKELSKGINVPLETVDKWLNTESIPEKEQEKELAAFFGISVYQLYSKDMEIGDYVDKENKEYYKKVFAYNFRKVLDEREYSKTKLAETLGIFTSTIWSWIYGRFLPEKDTQEKLSEIFEMDFQEFLKIPDEIKKEIIKEKKENEQFLRRKIFIRNLCFYMKRANISFKSLSEQTSIKLSTIGNWMTLRSCPLFEAVFTLAKFFNIKTVDLLDTPENTIKGFMKEQLSQIPEDKYEKLYEVVSDAVQKIIANREDELPIWSCPDDE